MHAPNKSFQLSVQISNIERVQSIYANHTDTNRDYAVVEKNWTYNLSN